MEGESKGSRFFIGALVTERPVTSHGCHSERSEEASRWYLKAERNVFTKIFTSPAPVIWSNLPGGFLGLRPRNDRKRKGLGIRMMTSPQPLSSKRRGAFVFYIGGEMQLAQAIIE